MAEMELHPPPRPPHKAVILPTVIGMDLSVCLYFQQRRVCLFKESFIERVQPI